MPNAIKLHLKQEERIVDEFGNMESNWKCCQISQYGGYVDAVSVFIS